MVLLGVVSHVEVVFLLVIYDEWKLVLVHFEIVLVWAQDRTMVFFECTSGMEIILCTPDPTPR